jgi:hypothetical protein
MTTEIIPAGCRRLNELIAIAEGHGANTSDQLRELMPAASLTLSEEEVERLATASNWPRARTEPDGHEDH